MNLENNIHEFMEKVKKLEKGEKLDLSSDEDLSMGIMNLVSMEEHFFFTYNKTKNEKYLDLLNEVREMRKELLKRVIKDYEGEVWCISKHLLAASMRLMEVGTKSLTKGDKKDAGELFQKSYQLYCLFWALNLGQFDESKVKSIPAEKDETRPEQPIFSTPTTTPTTSSRGLLNSATQFFQRMINCCKE
jgi:hypothetical protein